MIADPAITIPLQLTPEDRLRIYRKMVSIHFFNYPETFSVPSNSMIMPHSTYSFKVRSDHKTKTIYWDQISPTQNAPSRHLMELIRLIEGIVEAKPAYKKLPPARGGYA
jgi:hypothetical protein